MCGLVAFNYSVDLQGIFRDDAGTYSTPPNLHFTKVRYLSRHPERFDSFVFGSSRVGNIDVRNIPGGRWYNMTYSEGVPREHLLNIAYMLKSGIKIKNVLIGLDEFSYSINPDSHLNQISRMPYSPVVNQSEVSFYVNYLFRLPNVKVLGEHLKIHRGHSGNRLGVFKLSDTGQSETDTIDRLIEADRLKHVRDKKFLVPTHLHLIDTENMDGTLKDIHDLLKLAQQHDIKMIIFINPIHQVTYKDIDNNKFFVFKQRLAQITSYYDFSGLHPYTCDNYYFYETSHYRPIIGNKIIARIYGNSRDKEFGVLVNSGNIASHVRRQLAELDSTLPRL